MRYARRTDDNHGDLVRALRKCGVWVWSTAGLGGGFPDLLCFARGRFVLLEVKDGAKVPSARALSPAEEAFHASCPGPVHVVTSLDGALSVLFPQS